MYSNLLKENWHYLNLKNSSYSLKCLFNDNDYEILLFKLNDCSLYHEKKLRKDIEQTLNKLNSSIEAPINKINIHLKNCLTVDSESCEFVVRKQLKTKEAMSVGQYDLTINMESKLAGVPFKWTFELKLLDVNAIKEHLLVPLMYNCAEYQLRENELLKIIQNKDKEIDDYKSQGIKLNRKYLETEVFNADSFNKGMIKVKAENLNSPEKALYSTLAHVVNESCASKYYENSDEIEQTSESDKSTPVKTKTPTKNSKETPKSKETQESDTDISRREALRRQLQEEEVKKATKIKKPKFV